MDRRYSFSGNEAVESLVTGTLQRLSAEFSASALVAQYSAVILGGGYGRGEGGATPDGKLYNDLDFFVITNTPKPSAELLAFLAKLSRKWSGVLGVEVDFCCVSRDRLRRNRHTLMIQELIAGCEVIFGGRNSLEFLNPSPWSELPKSEGVRLMLNRGAGLLMGRRKLAAHTVSEDDTDFIRRNIRKAELGCGDAWLIARGEYCRTGSDRLDKLESLNAEDELKRRYRAALAYKYTPQPAPDEDLHRELEAVIALWLRTWKSYPGVSYEKSLRSAALNLRYASKLGGIRPLFAHPRFKLLSPLTELLENRCGKLGEKEFLRLWERFN